MKRKIYVLLTIFVVCVCCVPAFAQDAAKTPQSQFAAGNYLYEQGEYEDAVARYEQLIKNGFVSYEIFYNLANGYYKTDRLGKAILNYERALISAPRDKDTKINLAIAKSQVTDEIKAPVNIFIQRFVIDIHNYFTAQEQAYFFAGVLAVFTLLSVIAIYAVDVRRRLMPVLVFVFILLIAAGSSCAVKINEDKNIKRAVVISDQVEVRSGPGEQYSVQFEVHEGSEFRIVKTSGDWVEAEISGELRGWIEKKDIETIWPPIS